MINDNISENISVRQTVIFIMSVYLGMIFLSLPAFYAQIAGRDLWILYLAVQLIQIIIVAAFIVLYCKFPGQDIYQILKKVFKTGGAKIILSIMFVFFAFKFFMSLQISSNYYSEHLFEKESFILYLIPVLTLFLYAAFKGLRYMGRLLEIMLIFAAVSFVLILVLSTLNADFVNVFPVAADGIGNVLSKLGNISVGAGEPLVLFMLCGKTSKEKNGGLKFSLTAIICILAVAYFLFVYYAVDGSASQYPVIDATRAAELPPQMVMMGRTDWLLKLLYSVFSIAKNFLFFYSAAECVRHIFNLKNIKIPCVILAAASFIVPRFMPDYINLDALAGNFRYLFLIPAIVIPFIILILSLIIKKENRSGYEN